MQEVDRFGKLFEIQLSEHKAELDALDFKILKELQINSRNSFREIAKHLKISTSTLIARVKRLESEGVIKGYSAILDSTKIGYEFMALIEITIEKGPLLEVQKKIAILQGVVGVYDVTGTCDSIVFVKTRSRAELSKLVKTILAIPEVERTNTHVILNVIKEDNKLFI